VEYVHRKEDSIRQTVGTNEHNINSAVLQRARLLKIELQRGTGQIKDSIAKKTKERRPGRRMHGQFPRNLDEKLADIEQSYETFSEKQKVQ
jgi:hypothetical protein